jgi:hypothetical protein
VPDVETITGSLTSGAQPFSRIARATRRTMEASASMPVLSAAGGRSSAMAVSWALTMASGTASTARTPRVFWAVRATMTDVPKTPNCWNVLRSAWMPAPPPESEPAIVSAIFIR